MKTPDNIKVKVPGGFEAEAQGSSPVFLAFLTVLVAVFIGALAYLAEAKAAERHGSTVEAVKRLELHIARQEETVRALIWVITRPQAEREALNLQKPDILRRMAQ